MIESLEFRVLYDSVAVSDELRVTIGGVGGPQSVAFADADGTASIVTFASKSGASSVVTFAGSDLVSATGNGGIVVTGTITHVKSINIGSTAGVADKLAVKTKGGDGRLTVSNVEVNGSLKLIAAKTVDLRSTNGAASVFNLNGGIAKLDLGSVAGVCVISGDARTISVGSTTPDMSATFASVAKLSFDGDLLGDITARAINTMIVKGNYEQAALTLTQPISSESLALGRLTVGGRMNNVTVRSESSLGTISTGKLIGSSIYAGMGPTVQSGLPDDLDDFKSSASIAGIVVKSREPRSFSGASISARSLGKVRLGGGAIDIENATSFGIAADRIASVSLVDGSGKPARLANLDDPDAALVKIGRLGLNLGLFEIRLRFFGVAT